MKRYYEKNEMTNGIDARRRTNPVSGSSKPSETQTCIDRYYLSLLPKSRTVRQLRKLLARMVVVGLFLDSAAVNEVITTCSRKCVGILEYAELTLKQADVPYIFSCNSVIRGYEQCKRPSRSLGLYNWMLLNGISPDKFTFPFVLKACSGACALMEGEKIHCRILKSPLCFDLFVQASILTMYAKCGEIKMACLFFSWMPHKSLVSWNTMINSYVKQGKMDVAIKLFYQMPERDLYTWNVMIDGYAKCGHIDCARHLFDEMPERDTVTWNIMIDGYAKSGNMKYARELFGIAPFKDIVTWGIIINAYAINDYIGVAHNLFEKTPYKSPITWNCLINGYVKFKDITAAGKLFGIMPSRNPNSWNIMLEAYVKCGEIAIANQLFFAMPNKDVVSWNILIDGHARHGKMEIAREIFDTMPYKDVVSWNTIFSGYKQNERLKEVFELFVQMQVLEESPDCSTLAILLSCITDLGLLFHGRQVHAYVYRKDYLFDSIIGVALIEMYSKCGYADSSMQVFDMISIKSVDHWNAMLSGLASHGCGNLAVSLFAAMEFSMVKPDDVTFVAILKACSHAGLVSDGYQYFMLMRQQYGITPNVQHYGCMVDLLSRSGNLKEAVELVNNLPMRANDVVWRALLGASKTHGSIEIAELAAMHLIELVPNDSSSYVLLANIYGYKGQHGNAQNIWKTMNKKGVLKNTACSYIELQCQVHQFTAGGFCEVTNENLILTPKLWIFVARRKKGFLVSFIVCFVIANELVLEVKRKLEKEHPSLPIGKNGRDDEDVILWFLKDRKYSVEDAITKLTQAIVS